MARFVFIIIAILRTRFVSITTVIIETLCKYIFIVTTIIIIIIRTTKTRTEQAKKERAERDTYLDMRNERPLLTFPGFNALFYTICPRGHQRSPLSPIRSIMADRFLELAFFARANPIKISLWYLS